MKIRSAAHRGLKCFIEDVRELSDVPGWKAHQLSGDRQGTWSLTVTRNWRITFGADLAKKEIFDLDCEDYH